LAPVRSIFILYLTQVNSKSSETVSYIVSLILNSSYVVEVVGQPSDSGKAITLKINGKKVEVELEDKYDILLKSMGFDFSASNKLTELKAPMPGLVIDVMVKPGEIIQKGDGLIVLEAMKMENIIKASGEGVIKDVKIKKGVTVEKNQVMIGFE